MSEIDTTVSILERDLRSVATWCCKNQLLINPDKTKFIIIGTRQLLKELPTSTSMLFYGKGSLNAYISLLLRTFKGQILYSGADLCLAYEQLPF